jgi:hypothetical protein
VPPPTFARNRIIAFQVRSNFAVRKKPPFALGGFFREPAG